MSAKAAETAHMLGCGFAVGDRITTRTPPGRYYGTVTRVLYRPSEGWTLSIRWDGGGGDPEYPLVHVEMYWVVWRAADT